MASIANHHGQRLQGRVRSFKDTWGFLNSEAFKGDLFVGLKDNPHLRRLAQDDQVEFEVQTNDKGKSAAVNVTVLSSLDEARDEVHGNSEPQKLGSRHRGVVRSFKEMWGFIVSDSFEGDCFFGLKSNPALKGAAISEGEEVEFEIRTDDKGKAEAVQVVLVNQPQIAASQPAGPAVRAEVGGLIGHVFQGRIKSFRDQWGFVNSDSFPGDLFIHQKSNPELGSVASGDLVEFEIAEDPTNQGNQQAVNAVVIKEDVQTLLNQRVRGWVKSFRNDWGFLNSARFEGDVFVGLKENPHLQPGGLAQGEHVEFVISADPKAAKGLKATAVKRLNEAGPPNGTARGSRQPSFFDAVPVHSTRSRQPSFFDAVPAQGTEAVQRNRVHAVASSGGGGRAPPPPPQSFFRGVVRNFRGEWGFIVSDQYDGDLFVHKNSIVNGGVLSQGDEVSFELTLSATGKRQADNVQVLPKDIRNMVGQRCFGQVRSFKDTWGFLTSSSFQGDLFVGVKNNAQLDRPLQQGDMVEFIIQPSSGGKSGFEAVSVAHLDGRPAAVRPASGRPVAIGASLGMRDRSRSPAMGAPRARPAATSGAARIAGSGGTRKPITSPGGAPREPTGRDPGDFVGQELQGWVKSYRGTWGFVNSDAFDGDLFVGSKKNKHLNRELVVKEMVRFQVSCDDSGKLEAIGVEPS